MKLTESKKLEHLNQLKSRQEPPAFLRSLLDETNITNRWCDRGSSELAKDIRYYVNSR